VAIGVVVKLVEDGRVDGRALPFAERDVREDLRGAADDWRIAIDARVAGHHANPFGAELAAEREELFAHERLDRAGVEAPATEGGGEEMERRRDERFSRPGRRIEDDVLAGEGSEDRLFLRRIELELLFRDVRKEGVEEGVLRGSGAEDIEPPA